MQVSLAPLFGHAINRLCTLARTAAVLAVLSILLIPTMSARAQQSTIEALQAEIASHLEDDVVKADLLIDLADAYLFVDPEKGEQIARRALAVATSHDYPRGIANANRVIGRSFQFRGLYGEDQSYFKDGYKVALEADLKDVVADILRNMGSHFLYTGEFTDALENFSEALRMAKLSGDKVIIGEAYIGLGTAYNKLRNYTDAEINFQEGLKAFQETDDLQGVAIVYASLGEVRENIQDYDSALRYLGDALIIMEQVGDISGQAYSYTSIGNVQNKRGEFDLAVQHYRQALELGAKIPDLDILAQVNSSLGQIFLNNGNSTEAEASFKAALSFSKQGGNREEQIKVHEALAGLYRKNGDFERALEQLVLHNEMYELLYPKDYSDSLAELQSRFEATERESEINRLRSDNAESELNAERGRVERNIAVSMVLLVVIVLLGLANGYVIKARASRQVQGQNQRLIEVRRELERANRVKSEILANTSHEIRTPLNGILGLVTLLLDSNIDKDQRNQVKSIEHSGRTLLHLVNDILDLSRIEAGKLEIENGPCDIRAELGTDLRIWQEQAEVEGLVFTAEIADDLPNTMIAAGSRILQILANFVSNAIKFTETGGVTLRIKLLEDNEDHAEIRFEVQDTGVGIARDDQCHLFERFSQIDTSSTRAFGGTGLGLAISKELVEIMGGKVGIESDEGIGSTFWFSLILEKAESLALESEDDERPFASVNGRGAEDFRILLAEDNEINRTVIEGLVRRSGYELETANDGEEVLERLRVARFDLVLMDIQMPRIDGVTATKWIRAMDGDVASTKIVALTANAMVGDREKYLNQGFNDYISKPIEPVAFRRLLDRFARMAGQNGAAKVEANCVNGKSVAPVEAPDTPPAEAQKALRSFVDSL